MFERLTRLRPVISTCYELIWQERAILGPRIASMPIVRETVLGSSRDRTAIEQLRECLLSANACELAAFSRDGWVASLPAQRAFSLDIRVRRGLGLCSRDCS